MDGPDRRWHEAVGPQTRECRRLGKMAEADRDWKPAERSPAQDYNHVGVKDVKFPRHCQLIQC